jgi:hypothetical protein
MATGAAKGIAAMLTSPGKPGQYLQNCDPDEQGNITLVATPAAPHIAIATGVGSGEECTSMGSMIDGTLADTLMPMVGPSLYPNVVISDPNLISVSGPGLLIPGSSAQDLTGKRSGMRLARTVTSARPTPSSRSMHSPFDEHALTTAAHYAHTLPLQLTTSLT